MKEIKSGWHPAAKRAVQVGLASAILMGSAAVVLMKFFSIKITIASASSNSVPMIQTEAWPTGELVAPAKIEKPDAAAIATKQGNFRIRNRSDHPVRVALLSRRSKETSPKGGIPPSSFALPAHWDFAPQEGSQNGLLISLPNRSIQLKRGDVVVAFAQDGSQRYWGPFVVGETDRPDWNAEIGEWDLVLDN